MATNNNGNLLDSSGNVFVDFVWGNFPMQPNDDRTDGTAVEVVANNASGNYSWTGHSVYPSARLNAALDNHAIAEADWAGYPAFVAAAGNYIVTAVSGDGTTVSYTSQNQLAAGDTVNITGLTASAYNLSAATVATANKLGFTVTNAANAGLITGQYGKVQSTTALSAADGAGIAYINVPSVVGATTAVALDLLKDAGYEAASITTATAATNAAKAVTAIARTAGSTTVTVTSTAHGFTAGQKVVLGNSGEAAANGTYTVLTASANSFTASGTVTTVLALTGLTATAVGLAGTIKTQSVAAGTGSVATTATITITPFATAS